MVKTRFHYLDRRDFFFQREFDVETYENKTIPNITGTYYIRILKTKIKPVREQRFSLKDQ